MARVPAGSESVCDLNAPIASGASCPVSARCVALKQGSPLGSTKQTHANCSDPGPVDCAALSTSGRVVSAEKALPPSIAAMIG